MKKLFPFGLRLHTAVTPFDIVEGQRVSEIAPSSSLNPKKPGGQYAPTQTPRFLSICLSILLLGIKATTLRPEDLDPLRTTSYYGGFHFPSDWHSHPPLELVCEAKIAYFFFGVGRVRFFFWHKSRVEKKT